MTRCTPAERKRSACCRPAANVASKGGQEGLAAPGGADGSAACAARRTPRQRARERLDVDREMVRKVPERRLQARGPAPRRHHRRGRKVRPRVAPRGTSGVSGPDALTNPRDTVQQMVRAVVRLAGPGEPHEARAPLGRRRSWNRRAVLVTRPRRDHDVAMAVLREKPRPVRQVTPYSSPRSE